MLQCQLVLRHKIEKLEPSCANATVQYANIAKPSWISWYAFSAPDEAIQALISEAKSYYMRLPPIQHLQQLPLLQSPSTRQLAMDNNADVSTPTLLSISALVGDVTNLSAEELRRRQQREINNSLKVEGWNEYTFLGCANTAGSGSVTRQPVITPRRLTPLI